MSGIAFRAGPSNCLFHPSPSGLAPTPFFPQAARQNRPADSAALQHHSINIYIFHFLLFDASTESHPAKS
jgi:hypothetical protein